VTAGAKPVFVLHAEQHEETIAGWLGHAEYSYYFVLRAFRPVLETIGAVVTVRDVGEEDSDGKSREVLDVAGQIEAVVEIARRLGHPALHLSFSPPHRTPLGLAAPTIPVFAWEFYEIPCESWDDEPRHDWRAVLTRLGAAITHSAFAVRVVRAAMGEAFPIVAIPAPVWDRFAALGEPTGATPARGGRTLASGVPLLDTGRGDALGSPIGARATVEVDLDEIRAEMRGGRPSSPRTSPGATTPLALDGVVYTTVLSPCDGRKNWPDLLRAFCLALRDRDDATLVMKLVVAAPTAVPDFARELVRLRPFRCRVVVLDAFLSDEDYARLARASTYAVNASSGEGQCLPLMEYMSAGKPAVTPDHTAMADYVDAENAFIVATSLEPASWPQDSRALYRTSRHRLDMASLMAAFRESHRVAREDPERYRAMSRHATERLRAHCSAAVVREKLVRFLEPRLRAAGTAALATPPAPG
jgi:hypothetical protein